MRASLVGLEKWCACKSRVVVVASAHHRQAAAGRPLSDAPAQTRPDMVPHRLYEGVVCRCRPDWWPAHRRTSTCIGACRWYTAAAEMPLSGLGRSLALSLQCQSELHSVPKLHTGQSTGPKFALLCADGRQAGRGWVRLLDRGPPARRLHCPSGAGHAIGLALRHGETLPGAHFAPTFLKALLGLPCTFEDLAGVDTMLHRSLVRLQQGLYR